MGRATILGEFTFQCLPLSSSSSFVGALCLGEGSSWGGSSWAAAVPSCVVCTGCGGAVDSDIVCGFDRVMALQFSANAVAQSQRVMALWFGGGVVAESTRDGTMIRQKWCLRGRDALDFVLCVSRLQCCVLEAGVEVLEWWRWRWALLLAAISLALRPQLAAATCCRNLLPQLSRN